MLEILELLGLLLATLIVVVTFVEILRSILRVTHGRATLVLPFAGGDKAALINEVLAEQLDEVEKMCRTIHENIRRQQRDTPDEIPLVDIGPASRALSEHHLGEHRDRFIADHPITGQAIGPITFGGISVPPDLIFSLSYRIRDLVARRTIRGSLYDFGGTTRLAASFTYEEFARAGVRERRPKTEMVVLKRNLELPGQLLNIVDDLAFRIVKLRVSFTSETGSWSAYLAFLEGYVEHIQFLQTGQVVHRDKAIALYSTAVETDPLYRLAHYNLGNLLYNRYLENENRRAINHFEAASQSLDQKVKALALAGVTMAYAQNVHRFGHRPTPWIELADAASQQAVQLDPDLEETRFARGWAHQIAGRIDEAIDQYALVPNLPGNSPSERQVKSFALNNRAYLLMTELNDLDGAERLLRQACELYANKMVYANLGEIYKRRGRFKDALDAYAEARKLDPLYANGLNETGMIYIAMAGEARDDSHRVNELLVEADRWHKRALGVVPNSAKNQRQEMSQAFNKALTDNGFPSEAEFKSDTEGSAQVDDIRAP